LSKLGTSGRVTTGVEPLFWTWKNGFWLGTVTVTGVVTVGAGF
jgi:hypothetical protein